GIMQSPGPEFAARNVSYQADDGGVTYSLDIAAAYPPEAGLDRWQRTIRLTRGEGIEITDDYAFNRTPQNITLSLLTPCSVESTDGGVINLGTRPITTERPSGSATITYDAAKFSPVVETVPIEDRQIGAVWGEQLFRIVFTVNNPAQQDRWAVQVTR